MQIFWERIKPVWLADQQGGSVAPKRKGMGMMELEIQSFHLAFFPNTR